MEEILHAAGAVTTFGAAAAVVGGILLWARRITEGVKCQLRSDMLRIYYRHRDEGCLRQYEAENFEHTYKAYVALGGNSFIGNVHKEVSEWDVVS